MLTYIHATKISKNKGHDYNKIGEDQNMTQMENDMIILYFQEENNVLTSQQLVLDIIGKYGI